MSDCFWDLPPEKSRSMIYRHFKNGKFYLYRHTGIDTTNERDGIAVVIYSPLATPDAYYVREKQEFDRKFMPVSIDEVNAYITQVRQ